MEHLRAYEVSVWTLQDSFITVLKPSNLEHKGHIVDPTMSLKDDGDNRFSMKIPMYIKDEKGELQENPMWHNVRNGTILVDLRKIKVIFNKNTDEEEVFEFLITNVEEEHQGQKKYCQIDCEGLAFHELGKQGYKIALEGADEIELAQKKFFEDTSTYSSMPQGTINYWADRVFANSTWRYSIQMDWSAHDGVTHQVYTMENGEVLDSDNYENFTETQKYNFNTRRANEGLRRRDRLYEDRYVMAWENVDDKLMPVAVQDETEKYRMIEGKESNRYNLSQSIAEVFQVFCKYKYYYDDNYHIIDREAIFYNNFLNESQGMIDLTYKYNTEHLTRKMDSTDLVNKMFVRPLNDADMPSGQTTIADTSANKSLEDYLLNFDYLYNVGTISQEQYDEITPYEAKLHDLNAVLMEKENTLILDQNALPEQKARAQTAIDARAAAAESLSAANALLKGLTDGDGEINLYNPGNYTPEVPDPQTLSLIKESGTGTCYCNLKTQGIIPGTISLYYSYNTTNHTLGTQITIFNVENDEFGNPTKVTGIPITDEDQYSIYALYKYRPALYYENMIKTYSSALNQYDKIQKDAEAQVAALEAEITQLEAECEVIVEQKNYIINKFERLMGPALREGKWQPEDEYSGYGDVHEETLSLTLGSIFYDPSFAICSIGWDNELFDEEQDFKFEFGADLQTMYYPCIKITREMLTHFEGIENFLSKLTFIYSLDNSELQCSKSYMSINSKMVFGYLRIKNTNTVTPVLMLLDAKNASEDQLKAMQNNGRLALISTDTSTGVITESDVVSLSDSAWAVRPMDMALESSYEMVYPRFFINSSAVKSPQTAISIKRNNTVLTNYEDFQILYRTTKQSMGYCITLKPHVVLYTGAIFGSGDSYSIHYAISTAALAIYLDAIQVLKENSFPKVSYDIDLMSMNKKFIYNAYQRLGQIAHINDYEFKFQNTMGYISELNLDLDKPWQDKVTIKNYKTKFEDLFSTIVAETEQMKKNSAIIGLAASAFDASGMLSESLLSQLLDRLSDLTTTWVPTAESIYMQYEPYIRSQLRETYVEAGKVLAAAQSSVSDVEELNIQNADILALFRANVRDNLTPTNFTQREEKRFNETLQTYIEDFKVGDIWTLENGNVYMATENSHQIVYDTSDNRLTSLKGWSQLSDGTLAQIKGATLDIDTKAGKIQILAQNEINIGVNGLLKLAGQDVKIIGNKTVEIGGPDVKIYSASSDTSEAENRNRGVHIYATRLGATNASATVDICGTGITMRAANGIRIQSGEGITISTSDSATTSAIEISRDKGIWMGSTKSITFYSGETTGSGSASARINKDRILFGVSNGATGTAVDLTKDYIVFGAGNIVNGSNPTSIGENSDNGAAGVKITRDAIKMTTGSGNSRSYFSLTQNELELGVANYLDNGGFIKMEKIGKVTIGVGNTSNMQTNQYDDGTTFKQMKPDSTTARFQVYAPNFIVDENGSLYAYNAYISGVIRAGAGSIGGWALDANTLKTRTVDSSKYVALSSSNDYAIWAGNFTNSAAPFSVKRDGTLKATKATITGVITATSGTIGGCVIDASGNLKIPAGNITAGTITASISINAPKITGGSIDINNGTFKVDSNGVITATSGTIGGCVIENNILKIKAANIVDTLSIGQVNGAIDSSTATTIANGCITTATINCDQLSGGTINGQTISGGTITGAFLGIKTGSAGGILYGNTAYKSGYVVTADGDGLHTGYLMATNAYINTLYVYNTINGNITGSADTARYAQNAYDAENAKYAISAGSAVTAGSVTGDVETGQLWSSFYGTRMQWVTVTGTDGNTHHVLGRD